MVWGLLSCFALSAAATAIDMRDGSSSSSSSGTPAPIGPTPNPPPNPCNSQQQLCLGFLCISVNDYCPEYCSNVADFNACNTSGRQTQQCMGCVVGGQQICLEYARNGQCPPPRCEDNGDNCATYMNSAGNDVCQVCYETGLCLNINSQCPKNCEALSFSSQDLCSIAVSCKPHCSYCRSSSFEPSTCDSYCAANDCTFGGCHWSSAFGSCSTAPLSSCIPLNSESCAAALPCVQDDAVGCVPIRWSIQFRRMFSAARYFKQYGSFGNRDLL